jgi:hypothetical protein
MEIEKTTCLERILALPRRPPVCPPGLAEELTELLKTPEGKMTLRPLQALALHDIGVCGGALLLLGLGHGKTLTSLLAPYILEAKRPLLILPANLIKKTAREARELSKHWLVPSNVRLISYQMLGLVQSARDLEVYAPDAIIADELHRLKNRDAAVTRRVERYMEDHPETKFVGMTATAMRSSILDFAHLARWALKDRAPVPLRDQEASEWALALDERVENEFQRMQPGALLEMSEPLDIETDGEIMAARRGFKRRLRETPGVVVSAEDGSDVDVKLSIRAVRYEVGSSIRGYYQTLRDDKIAPTGEDLWEATEIHRHAKELALGFCQRWDPPAPEDWKAARKAWAQFVRGVLQRSRTWDSPDHVASACDLGKLPNDKLVAWRQIKRKFIPHPVPVWHDDTALKLCAKWMKTPGIVWVSHVPFGERLSKMTGARYYREQGLSTDGQVIEDADPSEAVIASSDSNREGRNLQKQFYRNLITSMPEGWDSIHQLIGRTHRPGQTRDVVVDVLLGCAEHERAWRKACAGAYAARDTVGAMSKLLIALEAGNVEWPEPDEIASWQGPQWQGKSV